MWRGVDDPKVSAVVVRFLQVAALGCWSLAWTFQSVVQAIMV